MKKLICLLLCFTIVNFAIGQTSNENRIKELPELIEESADNKDYNLALKLEDELAIRKELQEAINKEDYEKATVLREDLYDLESGDYNRGESNSDQAEKETASKNAKDNTIFYMDFAIAGINMFSFDANNNYIGPEKVAYKNNMYSFNFKLGHKFYFGPGARKFRVGIDIKYVGLNLGLDFDGDFVAPNIALSIPSPGFVMTYHINDEMGIDFQTNVGVMFLISEYNDVFILPTPGFGVYPQLRFWYNKLGVGLQYSYNQVETIYNIDRLKLNHFGLFLGLRF
jgi:hypothetical protein